MALRRSRDHPGVVGRRVRPVPYTANYAAAKAYLTSLGQALAYELKPADVDVHTLATGPLRTEGAANAEGIDFGKLPVPPMQPARSSGRRCAPWAASRWPSPAR